MKQDNTTTETLKDLESKIDTLSVKLLVDMRRELYKDFVAYTVAMQEYHHAIGYKDGYDKGRDDGYTVAIYDLR